MGALLPPPPPPPHAVRDPNTKMASSPQIVDFHLLRIGAPIKSKPASKAPPPKLRHSIDFRSLGCASELVDTAVVVMLKLAVPEVALGESVID